MDSSSAVNVVWGEKKISMFATPKNISSKALQEAVKCFFGEQCVTTCPRAGKT